MYLAIHHECTANIDLRAALQKIGAINSATLHSHNHPNGVDFDEVLDYSKCDQKSWEEQLQDVLEAGVVNYALQNEDGSYGKRRDFTDEEKTELSLWPVHFSQDGKTMFYTSYIKPCEDPFFYASRAVPDSVMKISLQWGREAPDVFYFKDGATFPG